jgi:DhnA family fructose-bisphosphate aldolase class Ia
VLYAQWGIRNEGEGLKCVSDPTTDNPIDLTCYKAANCYMGRVGLINSGGAAGENNLMDAMKTAVINTREGGA